MSWTPPSGMDSEIIDLCVAMNALPGIVTVESCSGHYRDPIRVWFALDYTEDYHRGLLLLARVTCPRYAPSGWRIEIYHDDVRPLAFMLEGPAGAFGVLKGIVEHIEELSCGGHAGWNRHEAEMLAQITPAP